MPTEHDRRPNDNPKSSSPNAKALSGPQRFPSPTVLSGRFEGTAALMHYWMPLSSVALITGECDASSCKELSSLDLGAGTYAIATPEGATAKNSNAEIYVGSSHTAASRLSDQLRADRFQDGRRFFLIYSSSDDLNSEHARSQESVVQMLAAMQPNTTVTGKTEYLRKMGRHDQALMERLVPDAIGLLAAAGFPLNLCSFLHLADLPFMPGYTDPEAEPATVADPDSPEFSDDLCPERIWTFAGTGNLSDFVITGHVRTDGRFEVHPGAHFQVAGRSSFPSEIQNRRDEIMADGLVSDRQRLDGRLVLEKACILSTPRVAVQVLTKVRRETEASWVVGQDRRSPTERDQSAS
ncbi:hypothetical protein N9H93_01295 [Rhizobiaceae bacterium]|nr:hypothetical protein [Rhizobiaceae bacterium]